MGKIVVYPKWSCHVRRLHARRQSMSVIVLLIAAAAQVTSLAVAAGDSNSRGSSNSSQVPSPFNNSQEILTSPLQVINKTSFAPVVQQQAVVTSESLKNQSNAPIQHNVTNNCPLPCTNAEYLLILNKISLDVDILRDFQRNESSGTGASSAKAAPNSGSSGLRPECIRQLIQMIKDLASGELGMKTLLEFASSTSQINLRADLSYLRASYAKDKERDLERARAKELQSHSGVTSDECQQQQQQAEGGKTQDEYYLLGDEPSSLATDLDKTNFLPKFVASVDQWLDTFERFTITNEWAALRRAFAGAESILNMFVNATTASTSTSTSTAATATAIKTNKLASLSSSATATVQKTTGISSELLSALERDLPGQVQILTSSLNQLFPWHVWPWNNIDLYSTIDTFLNHGIFAFSKTTAGPERRIDYLPQMLETLFKSLKYDSFPKKCNDWSRMICDAELFYEQLALPPASGGGGGGDSSSGQSGTVEEQAKRKQQVKELAANNKNKLTQELVCIMFSSLSMQQFGAKDIDFKSFDQLDSTDTTRPANQTLGSADVTAASAGAAAASSSQQQQQAPLPAPSSPNQLKWNRQIRKALKLYKLSREALNDQQWQALHKQLNELWSQMKISDRVIMVGRIIQLLTNCHMPREILESALWKDIYKYKNALNQVSDIVIEELNRSSENGKFTIEQLAIGSKHLEDILTRFIKLLPRLIESLSHTLVDQLPELVSKFFDEKIAFFKGPCKGHSFSELVPSLSKHSQEILELEKLVCAQLATKPSITMSQINNLTNEFLAMALNFTNFGGSFQSLPQFWTNNFAAVAAATGQGHMSTQQAKAISRQVATVVGTALAATANNWATTRPTTSAAAAYASHSQPAAVVDNANSNLPPAASVPTGNPSPASVGQEQEPGSSMSRREDNSSGFDDSASKVGKTNGTSSIIDELAANPRLAQIVAILQSSALDPPEVHAELPELDWVEAGTSVALFYETIQKLLSYEGLFVVFPEVDNFQEEMRRGVEASKRMFTKFSKKDPTNLVAYLLDTLMPVALRTFQPLDSFHSECFSTFRDIFGETDFVDATVMAEAASAASNSPTAAGIGDHSSVGGGPNGMHSAPPMAASMSRESRQWQCAVSATNFASFALNNLIRTFNSMLRNILNQMSRQRDLFKFKQQQQQAMQQLAVQSELGGYQASASAAAAVSSGTNNATCVLFDGSITTLMDNLPQLVDLGLETILIASTNTKERQTLKETMCSFENTLDPLGEQQHLQRQFKLREAICHLLHESSLATCSAALKVDQWTSTMKELNVTWFEMSAISVEPSFRGILKGVHEFLDLFGKVKPSSMSDGLIARVLNFNSYWTGLMNKAVSSVEKYREKRFQLASQILIPVIYDNLPAFSDTNTNASIESTRLTLKTSILTAKALLSYFSKPDFVESTMASPSTTPSTGSLMAPLESAVNKSQAPLSNATNTEIARGELQIEELIDQQLRTLFDWADRYSMDISEALVKTLANNVTKLEVLFNTTDSTDTINSTWTKFCLAPVETYFVLAANPNSSETSSNGTTTGSLAREVSADVDQMTRAKAVICAFEWSLMRDRLFQQKAATYPVSSSASSSSGIQTSLTQAKSSFGLLDQYSTLQLVRISLTKWGQVLDLLLASSSASTSNSQAGARNKPSRLPKFFSLNHWKPLQAQLPQILPSHYEPTNFIWVWQAFERLVNVADSAKQRQLLQQQQQHQQQYPLGEALTRVFDQLNCALDVVKGGITWDNMVNIYQDRQDVLAAHTTLNNGIALASASANTFLAHKKFQKFLNNFVKPRIGLAAFCDMRDRSRLESIFSLTPTNGDGKEEDILNALESFQEFICDTNLEAFVQNINPISVCYHQLPSPSATNATSNSNGTNSGTQKATSVASPNSSSTSPLADTIDRFFKLASLAILDAKLVDTNDAKPPIFDKSQWDQLRLWWLNQTEAHEGNSGLALTLVRVFQTLDSINSEHVVWRAIFRSVHELSEVSAYLVRAAEMERQASIEMQEKGQPTKLALIREAAEQVESAIKDNKNNASSTAGGGGGSLGDGVGGGLKFGHKQQQLASTMANVMFPEVSNFITLKTFKQLRYLKSISEYFASAPNTQELMCRNLTAPPPPTTTAGADKHRTGRRALSASGSDRQLNSTGPNGGAVMQANNGDDDDVSDGDSNGDSENNYSEQQVKQQRSKFELIDYKLNSSKRLYSLLCHYHSSQWLTAMNIVLSSKTTSLSKKVNYMTKYLLIFTKNLEHSENLQSFIHGQQLENIEAVANTTVSHLIALTQPFRTLTLSKISNISWHSIPNLLDSIDRHLCASKHEQQQQQQKPNVDSSNGNSSSNSSQNQYQLAVYEPKKPDIETIICKLPSWNVTQIYNYISENIDLQNMISLATQNNHTAKLLGISTSPKGPLATNQTKQIKACITPFKFASKWLKTSQDLIDESMSKSSHDKIRKCLSSNKKNQSIYLQMLRNVKILNNLLSTINDLTINNSWPIVRKTWNSISYALLNQSGQSAIIPASRLPAATSIPSAPIV